MFSPVYFEKLEAFIECLDAAAEIAYQHCKETDLLTLDLADAPPVCPKCFKRRKLDFNDSSATTPFLDISTQSDVFNNVTSDFDSTIDTSQSKQNLSSANASLLSSASIVNYDVASPSDVTRRHNSLRKDKSKIDSTFMSAMMKTLVTLNNSDSLNLQSNRRNQSVNETNGSKRKAFLRRRHTMLVENQLMLSASSNAAVGGGKNNATCDDANTGDKNAVKRDHFLRLRSNVMRKPRPYSYPNQQTLRRQFTAPVLCNDNTSQQGAKSTCESAIEGEKVNSSDNTSMDADNTDFICVDHQSPDQTPEADKGGTKRVKSISVKVTDLKSTTKDKSPHQMYYSLSPLSDSPLKIEDLGSTTVAAVQVSVKGSTPGSAVVVSGERRNSSPVTSPEIGTPSEGYASKSSDDSNMLSHDSSLSSNPEYFAIASRNRRRRRRRANQISQSETPGGFQSTPAPAKSVVVGETDVGAKTGAQNSPSEISGQAQCRTSGIRSMPLTGMKLHEGETGHLHAKATCGATTDINAMANSTLDSVVDGITSYYHGDGLLYTSSFGIGDHAWCSNLGDSDMTKDGYCKCSFCNHEMIMTPMRSETYAINTRGDLSEVDFSGPQHELLRTKDLNTSDVTTAMTSLRAAQYDVRSDLQTDHFPYPRLPKEFMTSDSDLTTSQTNLDMSMNVACSCDNESVASEDEKTARGSPTQKALQRDIEKHSSGVASVLNLCEVLLHDGDACSTDAEKESIEQATNSLDRRWRNICSLSMERKLKIEETQRLWQRFMEDYSRFSDWLRSADLVVGRPNTYFTSYRAARAELKKFESFQRQLHESLTQLELINKQYRRLARENRTDATNKLKTLIHDGNSRWDSLSHRVTCILRRLKYAIHRREDFETRREALLVWLTETDLRLTNVEHFMQSENYDKLKEVKNFQATIEEHIPRILDLDEKGKNLLEKSEETDCVTIEEELLELHRYCREVVSRLDRYHKRLLRIMNEPPPLDKSLFEDTDMAGMKWWENYSNEASSSRNSSPGIQSSSHERLLRDQLSLKLHGSNGSHSGRATPESLEWDEYDISQSELQTKNTGLITDDDSIPEISPIELEGDDVPLLQISRGSEKANLSASRRSIGFSATRDLDLDDLSPSAAKKQRTGQDEPSQQQIQFMNDLVATLAWLDATAKVANQEKEKSEAVFDKSIVELERDVKEMKDLQKSIEERKAIVLSIRLLASRHTDSDVEVKLTKMNTKWESLQEKSLAWNRSLQQSLTHSQEFQSTVSELSSWVDLQNQRRDDMSMTQHREAVESSPSSKMQSLRKHHKALDQIRIESLEAISKVTTMQEICIQLTSPLDGDKSHPVGGTRALTEKVRSINGRLNALLNAVRSDLRDMEHKIKAARRRAREDHSSASESESSTDTPLRASTPMRLRQLQRKVEASELHSCGKNPNVADLEDGGDELSGRRNTDYDITQESCSSIDSAYYDVTHKSLHSGSKENRKMKPIKAAITKTIAANTTIAVTETRKQAVAVTMAAQRSTKIVAVAPPPASKKKCAFCCRVCIAALPFYFLLLFLFLLPWLLQATVDDGLGCFRQNNYAFSFTPMLTYTNGPPPV